MDEQVPTWSARSAVDHLAGRRLASWPRRAAGFVIDAVLMGVVPLACFVAFGASLPPAQSGNGTPPLSASSAVWLAVALVLSLGMVIVYPVWFIGRRGQTPGMRRMRIRLSRIDAEDNLSDVDFATSWRRWLFALPFWVTALYGVTLLFDYLWPLRNRHHQCLHDKWARTVVLEDLM